MAQHTIDLPCIADTYTEYANKDTNYGDATILKASSYSGAPMVDKVIYMRFDHSILPVRKKIISATLRIYVTTSSHGDVIISHLKRPVWDEYVLTHNNFGPWSNISETRMDDKLLTGGAYNLLSLPAGTAYNPGQGLMIKLWTDKIEQEIILCHSRENTNPPMLRVTYEDVPPDEPTLSAPVSAYKDSASVIRFEWQYNSSVGGAQKKFDLQWSEDQSSWTTVSETTPNTYYDMPANTFPTGNIYWRVRCYNEYDEVGPYSDIQSFYAIGAPAAPVLNAIPANSARPVVSWSAFSQQVYQLQVLQNDSIVYDSGIVPGINIRSHKITAWLADGEYTVQMRIKNEYDMWSDWGSATVTISTAKPDKPTLTIQRSAYGIEINATGLVYRSEYDKDNFICIGTASGTYYDNTVASSKEYKYFVRAVSADETYNDSDIKFIQAEFQHALIAPASDLTNVFAFSKSLNAPPKRIYNNQPGGAQVQYAGRTHSVWEPDEHISAAWSMGGYYLDTWSEVEDFVALCDSKTTVLYRDARGRKMYGTLGNLSVSDELMGYTVSFTISQVDYDESVEV